MTTAAAAITFIPSENAAAFKYSRARYGVLSNMTYGFPLRADALTFSGPEALYQALKYPDYPELQRDIADAPSGMAAKKVAYRSGNPPVTPEWDDIRVDAMRMALGAKLAPHPYPFAFALTETGSITIVENSSRDDFWGAKPVSGGFRGRNILGRLLTELRDRAAPHYAEHEDAYPKLLHVAHNYAAAVKAHFTVNGRQFTSDDIS